jgi:hypothetical protein
MSPVRPLRPAAVSLFAFLALTAGCIFDPKHNDVPPPPVEIPLATTPENAVKRLAGEYEQTNIGEYGTLLTQDFRFTFSSQSDPRLVELYGNSWGRDDEIESTTHLFQGFVDDHGELQPRARALELSIPVFQEFEDPDHPDSLTHYRRIAIPRLLLDITLEDGRAFAVDAPHTFYLVRGDAAVLGPGQAPSAERWYVYRWDDLSAPLVAAAAGPLAGSGAPTAP